MSWLSNLGKSVGNALKSAVPAVASTLLPGVGGQIAGAVLGSALGGGGGSSGSTSASSLASGAPVQTAEQKEMMGLLTNRVKDNFSKTNPITIPGANKTSVSLGSGLSISQPSGSFGTGGSWLNNAIPQAQQAASSKTMAAPSKTIQAPTQSQSQQTTPSKTIPDLINIMKSQGTWNQTIQDHLTNYGILDGWGNPTAEGTPEAFAKAIYGDQGASRFGLTSGNKVITESQAEQINPVTNNQLAQYSQPAMQVTLPTSPTAAKTYGMQGQFQVLSTPSTAGYKPQEVSSKYQQVSAPEWAGYRELVNNSKISDLPDQTAAINSFGTGMDKVNNQLESDVEAKIRSDMNRSLQEGYDASYLQNLITQGLNPLKEAYDAALQKADADYNRTGLSNTSYLPATKYGAQPDSITRSYLTQVENLNRDVAIKGAEAAREDRFRNADLQSNAVNQGSSLSNAQISREMERQLQNKNLQGQSINMTSQQAAQKLAKEQYDADMAKQYQFANESNRQGWTDRATDLALKNEANRQWDIGRQDNLNQQNESDRQYWTQDEQNRNQTNEANRQWWSNFLDDQQQYDNTQDQLKYQNDTNTGQWFINRNDTLAQEEANRQMAQDEANRAWNQQQFNNALSVYSGQQPTVNTATDSYWKAQQQAIANQNQQAKQDSSIGSMISGLLTPKTKQTPVASTFQPITSAQVQNAIPASWGTAASTVGKALNSAGLIPTWAQSYLK